MIIEVNDLQLPELALYASSNEVRLKRLREPAPGIFIAETPNVILRALNGGYEAESMLIDRKLLEQWDEALRNIGDAGDMRETLSEILARIGDIPVYAADMETLSAISGFKQTRGVLAVMTRRTLPPLTEVIEGAKRIAILENVENPTNVGALFRSAAGIGFDAVLLTFRCADPLYRRSARVSMGTVFQIPWTFVGNKRGGWPDPAVEELKQAGFEIVSMALSDRAVPLDDPSLREIEKLAVIFGNEEEGIRKETLGRSDHIARIPMFHGVDSLNVAAAGAVTFWELRNRK